METQSENVCLSRGSGPKADHISHSHMEALAGIFKLAQRHDELSLKKIFDQDSDPAGLVNFWKGAVNMSPTIQRIVLVFLVVESGHHALAIWDNLHKAQIGNYIFSSIL